MARDFYHDHVVEALKKDGWKITHDPFEMTVDFVDYEIDLGAQGLIGATKENQKIAVEIKSFISRSTISEFHRMVGQFNDYFVALEEFEPDRVLYLAIPESTYHSFFTKSVIQKSLARVGAKIIVYNPSEKSIEKWIS